MIFASREVVKANLQNQDFLSGERRANRSRQPTRRSVARSAEWIWQNNVMCPYDGSNCPGTFFALTANWWRRLETVQHLYAFRRSERWNSSMLNKHAPFSPSRSRFSRHYWLWKINLRWCIVVFLSPCDWGSSQQISQSLCGQRLNSVGYKEGIKRFGWNILIIRQEDTMIPVLIIQLTDFFIFIQMYS